MALSGPWWDDAMDLNPVLIVLLIGIPLAVWLGVRMLRDR